MTRYAHLSKVLVKEGEMLQRGRRIAEERQHRARQPGRICISSALRGAAQNPTKFLLATNPQMPLAKAKP